VTQPEIGGVAVVLGWTWSELNPTILWAIRAALDDAWKLQLFHDAESSVANSSAFWTATADLVEQGLLIVTAWDPRAHDGADALLRDEFWAACAAPNVLVIGADAVCCSAASTKLAELVTARWDLVAAPTHAECACDRVAVPLQAANLGTHGTHGTQLEWGVSSVATAAPGQRAVRAMGVGSFSLHRREPMRRLLSSYNGQPSPRIGSASSLDCVYSCACARGDIACADAATAARLVVHREYEHAADRAPIGVVAPWLHLSTDELRLLLGQCAELDVLLHQHAIELPPHVTHTLIVTSQLHVVDARASAVRATRELRRFRTPSLRNVAVLVETRRNAHMQSVLQVFERALPSEFAFQIFHSAHNRAHVYEAARTLRHAKVVFSELDYRNGALSIVEYTQLLMSAEFWWSVAGETILLFQLDSVLCSHAYLNVTDFLHFDFVGAPWIYRHACQVSSAKVAVGNGGLSIRSRSKMLQLYERVVAAQLHADEDVHIGCACADEARHMACADVDHAAAFSVESIFHPAPVGVHKPWVHLDSQQLGALATNCPELALIMPADSEHRATSRH
jgi:hypothetical protein